MDGLKRQDRKKAEAIIEEEIQAVKEENEEKPEEEQIEVPKKQRKSFLDKLTEKVKDFLDNAE